MKIGSNMITGIVLSAQMCGMWIIWLAVELEGGIGKFEVGKRYWIIHIIMSRRFFPFVTLLHSLVGVIRAYGGGVESGLQCYGATLWI